MTEWPSWRYGPDGQAQIFNSKSEVPAGWSEHPSGVTVSTKTEPKAVEAKPKRTLRDRLKGG